MAEDNQLDKSMIQDLVERAKTDESAFADLYHHFFPKIFGYVFKRVGHRQTCEDLVSEIFLKTFSKLELYEWRGIGFESWLYKIASNQIIDHYRRPGSKAKVEIEQVAHLLPADEDIFLQTALQEDQAKIRETLSALPSNYEQVLTLKFLSELTNPEIAKIMDITENNVGVLVYRALKKFKELYKN